MNGRAGARPAPRSTRASSASPRPWRPIATRSSTSRTRIHADPEPAFEEHHAAAWVAEALARPRLRGRAPAGRLATAIRATLAGGRGGDGPRIGILAEYDALPGLGHGCGHNTMAAVGVGAAIALADLAPELRGEIVFLGTPAEERRVAASST